MGIGWADKVVAIWKNRALLSREKWSSYKEMWEHNLYRWFILCHQGSITFCLKYCWTFSLPSTSSAIPMREKMEPSIPNASLYLTWSCLKSLCLRWAMKKCRSSTSGHLIRLVVDNQNAVLERNNGGQGAFLPYPNFQIKMSHFSNKEDELFFHCLPVN